MGIERKSFSALLDEFTTNQIRLWFDQEDVMKGGDDAFVAGAAKKAQEHNARRNQLMRAIDAYFDDPNIPFAKSYDSSSREKQDREALLEAHLTGLADAVLHPTDTVMIRGLAQAAWDYLIATGEDE